MDVSVNANMVTTGLELPGYRVVKSLGLVRGVTVRSRSILGTLGASLETIIGGNITLFEEMCEATREQALDLMMRHAMERGANAVIGTRYDATEVMQGVTEVIAYGTAVQVERAAQGTHSGSRSCGRKLPICTVMRHPKTQSLREIIWIGFRREASLHLMHERTHRIKSSRH